MAKVLAPQVRGGKHRSQGRAVGAALYVHFSAAAAAVAGGARGPAVPMRAARGGGVRPWGAWAP